MSFPEDDEAAEQNPRNHKFKVHRDEKNRRDRGHSNIAPRAETVKATVEKQDEQLEQLEGIMDTKPRTKRKKAMRQRIARKSAIYASLMRRQMPRIRLSTFRPRKLSQERVWILATLTGAAAVFLLLLLQMAQTKAANNKQSKQDGEQTIQDSETKLVEAPTSTEPTQAELDQKRLARIDDMSQPAPEPKVEDHQLTFLERMERLRERPFWKKDKTEQQETIKPATKPQEVAVVPETPVSDIPDPIPFESQTPAPANEPSVDFNVDIASNAKTPTEKPVESLDSFLDEPKTAPPVEAPKADSFPAETPKDDPPKSEPLKSEDPFGVADVVAKTKQTPIVETPAPVQTEPVAPEPVVVKPEPILPTVPEPAAPEIANSPPDVDLNVKIERLPSARPAKPIEDPADQFVVSSESNPSIPVPAPSIIRDTGDGNWTRSKPESKDSLVKPNLKLENKPTWRIVAPVAEIGDPANIRTADTAQKELHVSVVKTAPRESSVQQMLTYEIIVRNDSAQEVDGLIIEEYVPKTMRVADVTPKATFEDETLQWMLKAIGPREERKLEVNLIPLKDGATESVTIARPFAAVATETQVDPSQLRLEVTSAPQVANGKICPLTFKVTNLGDSAVEEVVLHAELPEELIHSKGSSLDLTIDKLEPGETHTTQLNPRARDFGAVVMPASLSIGDNQVAAAKASLRIVKATAKSTKSNSRRPTKTAPPCNCVPCCP